MNLNTEYLGLKLKNPIIIGSSGLTDKVEKLIKLEENNAGAVVLKSLFEEQLYAETFKTMNSGGSRYPDAYDYIHEYTIDKALNEYFELISNAKKNIQIPVIASINCTSDSKWTHFAKDMESAGADAIELNISLLPSDPFTDSEDNEKLYFTIVEKVSDIVKIPISIKISHYSAELSQLIYNLSATKKVKGITLFNRFYNPDIDLDTLQITSSNVFSTPDEYTLPLRWIALLSGKVDADLCATTGIHDGKTAAKLILAGAQAVQIVSAIYKSGPEYINTIIDELKSVGKKVGFNSIEQMRGKLSYKNKNYNRTFERIQFMKYFGGIS
jgi:dihydroorotate dehydrogenase (fumarate)